MAASTTSTGCRSAWRARERDRGRAARACSRRGCCAPLRDLRPARRRSSPRRSPSCPRRPPRLRGLAAELASVRRGRARGGARAAVRRRRHAGPVRGQLRARPVPAGPRRWPTSPASTGRSARRRTGRRPSAPTTRARSSSSSRSSGCAGSRRRPDGDEDAAQRCAEIEDDFLTAHAGRWLPVFFGRLAEEAPHPVHRALGLVGHDAVLAELAGRGLVVEPSPPTDGLARRWRRTS